MKTKKKKTKKLKSSSSKKSKSKIDLRAAGEEYWNSPSGISQKASVAGLPDPYAVKVNVFWEARKIKTLKQLRNFFDKYIPDMTEADIAYAAIKFVTSSNKTWTDYKILKDPNYYGDMMGLLNDIEKLGGSLAAYNHPILDKFCKLTGYKKPKSAGAFQDDLYRIKKEMGLARTKTGEYKAKQFSHARAKEIKKNLAK